MKGKRGGGKNMCLWKAGAKEAIGEVGMLAVRGLSKEERLERRIT